MEIRPLTEDEFPLWDDFVDESPQGSIYSKSFWLKLISEIAGMRFRILAVFQGGSMCGGVGLCFRKTMFGDIVRCPLLTPYNSIILEKPSTKYPSKVTSDNLKVVAAIIHELETTKYASIEIRNRPSIDDIRAFSWDGWDVKVGYTYEVPLFNLEELKSTMAHSVRKQINKCEEANVHITTEDNYNEFHPIYRLLTSRRQNIPMSIGENKFKTLYENLKQHNCCRMYLAHLENGESISIRITLFTKNEVAHDWVAGANPEYFQTGATPFLLWKIIEDLSQQGYRYLDLNGANAENIARFKSEFGGKLVPYYTVRREKPFLKVPLFLARKAVGLIPA